MGKWGGGKPSKSIISSAKNAVDLIYSLTTGDGYADGWKDYGNTDLCRVVSELVKRGVLKKVHIGHHKYRYTWIATSEPTEHFYMTVAYRLAEIQNNAQENRKKKLHTEAEQSVFDTSTAEPEPESTGPDADKPVSLSGFSTQELWGELKRRGAKVVDGRLVIITELS